MPEPVTLDELKAWSRVDFDDDDALLESLGTAAREFIEQATGRTYTNGDVPERAKTAIMGLVAHWYDHREAVVMGGAPAEVPLHVSRLIHQLRDWRDPECAA